MEKTARYFVPVLILIVIFTCLVISPAAATSSYHVSAYGTTVYNSYQSSDSSRFTALMGHAVASYTSNPNRFSLLTNSTTFSVPTITYPFVGGSTGSTLSLSGLDSSFTVGDYTSTTNDWDTLFTSPAAAPSCSCSSS